MKKKFGEHGGIRGGAQDMDLGRRSSGKVEVATSDVEGYLDYAQGDGEMGNVKTGWSKKTEYTGKHNRA